MTWDATARRPARRPAGERAGPPGWRWPGKSAQPRFLVHRMSRVEFKVEIEDMHSRIEQMELEALQAQVRLAQELEEVRRSFRAELTVPYRGGLELVRAADARSPFKPPRKA